MAGMSVRVPEDLHLRLKLAAATSKVSVSDLATKILERGLPPAFRQVSVSDLATKILERGLPPGFRRKEGK